jgi:hypothetical protein
MARSLTDFFQKTGTYVHMNSTQQSIVRKKNESAGGKSKASNVKPKKDDDEKL